MKRRSRRKATRKAIFKQLWIPKWKGPTPTTDPATDKTFDKTTYKTVVDLSSAIAKTSSSFSKPYHCPVRSSLEPLLPKPSLTLLSLAISKFDLSNFFVALCPGKTPSDHSQKSVLQPRVINTPIPEAERNPEENPSEWVKVLPKQMKALSSDTNQKQISAFIHKKLKKISAAGKCFKCFQFGHLSKGCTNSQRCLGCERKGHFLNSCPLLLAATPNSCIEEANSSFSSIKTTHFAISFPPPFTPSSLPSPTSCAEKMAQPPLPIVPENPVDNSWAAMHPVHPLVQPIIDENWERTHFPSADEFLHHRPDRADVYLPEMAAPAGVHVRDISKAIHLTFYNGYPLEGDISHYLSTKFAQRYGGRHTDFRVAKLDVLASQYVVVVRSGDYRNQLCRTPSFDISTPTYAGPVILRPWNRAAGGFIERPSHWLKVRLEGAPLHLWRDDLLQILCSSFGTIVRFGDRSRFHDFRLLIMGKHPALVPRELMLSQDPVVKFADVILEGWAPLFDPPQNVPPVGPQLPWIPPYQPNPDDGTDSSGMDSVDQENSPRNGHGYRFGSQPRSVHRELSFSNFFGNHKSPPLAPSSLLFSIDSSTKSILIAALCRNGDSVPICQIDPVGPFLSAPGFHPLLTLFMCLRSQRATLDLSSCSSVFGPSSVPSEET